MKKMNFYSEKCAVGREASQRELRKQQREEAVQRLVDEVSQLLNDGQECEWTGSNSDLMEALHTAYLFGEFYDDSGQPCSFVELVRTACRLMNKKVPRNPSAMAARATRRKGIRKVSFFEKYCRMCYNNTERPLHRMIRHR